MNTNTLHHKRTLVNPEGTEEFYNTWQYSQGIRVGDTVWAAGQIGIGADGKFGVNVEEQTRLAFQNLSRVLMEAGSGLEDVVELVTYHLSMDDLPTVARVKGEFFSRDFPTWTVVGVTALALPELLIEIKATAVAGSGRDE